MNKREEIREEVKHLIEESAIQWQAFILLDKVPKGMKTYEELANVILTYLDSKDVVIKRDGELPESFGCHWVRIEDETFTEVIMDSKKALEKAGYTLTERLID